MSIKDAFNQEMVNRTKKEIRFLKERIKYSRQRVKSLEKMLESQSDKGE